MSPVLTFSFENSFHLLKIKQPASHRLRRLVLLVLLVLVRLFRWK
jgi:hypothetical protein